MKFDFFKEKYFDLLIINNKDISYFRITREKTKIKVLKSEKVNVELFSQGEFYFSNLEPALQIILKKHKLTELGIILNLPNIIFQKINLTTTTSAKEAILNHLKINFPLMIENYSLFYKQDKYRTSPSLSTFNVFLISKKIIDSLLTIIEKYGLIPIFISPSIEIFSQYLLNKTILDFNEEYLIFSLEGNTLSAFLIHNLRLEKTILEEYDSEKVNLELLISRIYNFLKSELTPTTKIIFFMEKKDFPEITQQKMFFPSPTINVFLEGGYFAFINILAERQVIDFSPFKNYTAYFLNRLPSIIVFLSVYLFILSLLISASYFVLQDKFKKETESLASGTKTIAIDQNLQVQLENLKNITSQLDPEIFTKFSSLNNIKNLPGFESLSFSPQNSIFSLKIDNGDKEKIKSQISQDFPQAKLIEENIIENKVLLKYNF